MGSIFLCHIISGEAYDFKLCFIKRRADWFTVILTANWDFYFLWLSSLEDLLQCAICDACLIHDAK